MCCCASPSVTSTRSRAALCPHAVPPSQANPLICPDSSAEPALASPGSPQPPTANLWVCLPDGPVDLMISILMWVNVIVMVVFYDLFLIFRAGQTLRLISRAWAPDLPAGRCLVTSARTLRRSQTSNHVTHPASSLSSKAMTRVSLKRWPHRLNVFHMWQVSKECRNVTNIFIQDSSC